MSKKKTILFVTNCDDKVKASKFEIAAKKTYHDDDEKPCLTFMHKPEPYQVDQRDREKKSTHIIFDGVSNQTIISVQSRIERRRNGALPKFCIIGGKDVVIARTAVYPTHEAVKVSFGALVSEPNL